MVRYIFPSICLILLPIASFANSLFIETEILTITRDVFTIHTGIEVRPTKMDAFATYMWGQGDRSSGSIMNSYPSDFDHQCFGLGIRINEDSRVDGRFQTFNLRFARTDWSAYDFDPIEHTHIALIWSQGCRYYTVGNHYAAWSFDLGLQRIDRMPNDRDAVKVSAIIGLSLYLGIYLF